MRLLEADGLSAGYGKVQVLRGLSFACDRGEIVVLVGHNGAGKSTCLKTVFGLLAPTAGRITLDGRDVTSLPAADRVRRGLAYVPQTSNVGRSIFPNHTVWENLELGGYASSDRTRVRSGICEALARFPFLEGKATVRAGLLSGGQQQMLAVAMGLVLRPALLLLDEPTSGLSPAMAQDLMRQVRVLRDELGVGVVIVEQNVRLALGIADRACVIRSGIVARESTPDQLMNATSVLDLV